MHAIPEPRMNILFQDLWRCRQRDNRGDGIHQNVPFIDHGHWNKHQYGHHDYVENGYKIGWLHDVGRHVTIIFDYQRIVSKWDYPTLNEAKQAIQNAWIELAMKI